MSATGWFRFQMDTMPEQRLDLKHAGITVFGQAGAGQEGRGSDSLSVNVDIWAAPRMVAWPDSNYPEEGAIEHRIAPAFYTEWLDMPRVALAGRGVDAVDGLRFDYDMQAPDAPPEAPGEINQDSHALLNKATMAVTHRGDGLYGVAAEGETEFGWTFALDAEAPLERIVFRHQERALQQAPDPAVEAEFDALFDRSAFACEWVRRGSPDHGWYDFIAARRGSQSGAAA